MFSGMPDESNIEPLRTSPSMITTDDIEPPSSVQDSNSKKNSGDDGEDGEGEAGSNIKRQAGK